MYVEQMKI